MRPLVLLDFAFPYFDAQSTKGGFAIWPATVKNQAVTVLIRIRELSYFDGEKFAINGKKIRDALLRHREVIQARASEKYIADAASVTLNVGDLT